MWVWSQSCLLCCVGHAKMGGLLGDLHVLLPSVQCCALEVEGREGGGGVKRDYEGRVCEKGL